MTSTSNKYVLNYFNRHGKVELCRLLFAVGNVEYQDNYIENYTDSGIAKLFSFFYEKHKKIYLKLFYFQDTQMGFMPYLEVNQTKIPLISVICR
jgi:hypothetical protein